ncbi:MAG: type VI secretion system tube protein Hcp [Gemmataceae bacterium]|jgi:type VI secretion system secreted protein Hcp|nr:type VI secretion system tube protein Hcp [Gemmataceae bacterium]
MAESNGGGVRIFVNINNLSPKGESTDKTYQNWIECIDYSIGVSNQSKVTSGTTGSGAGRASFKELRFRAPINASSATLLQACASGVHYGQVQLVMVRPGGTANVPYLTITLQNAFITNYLNTYGPLNPADPSAGVGHVDEVGISYGQINFSYTQQTAQGGAGSNYVGTWNITNNASS